jgi:deoxyadenosine/deoxycytidine kinase
MTKNRLKKILIPLILIACRPLSANAGKIIVFSGHSCSGKSTMARLLSKKINAECLAEPEESEWPLVVRKWYEYYASTAMLAMRQFWIPLYVDANKLRNAGKTVCIDTYFLKTVGYYIDKPGMEWLVPANDPYLPLLRQMYELDEDNLPDADCVVLFDSSLQDWKQFLQARGRDWDANPGFAESFAVSKKYVDAATIAHCKKYNIKLIHFTHQFGDPDIQAERLKELLIAENVLG